MRDIIKYLSLVSLLFITSSQAADSDLNQTHWNGSAYAENAQLQSGWAEAFFFNRYRFKGTEAVLDIGSGDGKLSAKIATAVSKGSVLGIDKSISMIDQANKKHAKVSNLKFELVDAQNAEFYKKYPEKFDLVVSFVTLHWVKDQLTVLKGIHQVLKPEGQFYLKLSSKGGDPIQDIADALSKQKKYHIYFNGFVDPMTRFSESDYQALLKQAHLQLVSISDHEEKDKVQNKDLLTKQIKSWLPHYHYLKLNDPEQAEQYINEVINTYLLKFPADNKGEITLYDHYLEVVGKKHAIS